MLKKASMIEIEISGIGALTKESNVKNYAFKMEMTMNLS